MNEEWEKFIEKSKNKYYKIGTISCPAFNNESVHFNKHGFTHLLRKDRKYRERNEQARRINLMTQVPYLLKKCKTFSKYSLSLKEKDGKNSTAHFWTFIIKEKRIHIVIRKLNSGNKHFFSVY